MLKQRTTDEDLHLFLSHTGPLYVRGLGEDLRDAREVLRQIAEHVQAIADSGCAMGEPDVTYLCAIQDLLPGEESMSNDEPKPSVDDDLQTVAELLESIPAQALGFTSYRATLIQAEKLLAETILRLARGER